MDFDDYSNQAGETAIFPEKMPKLADENMVGLLYCALKLNGEAGEIAECIGKALRDDDGQITPVRKDHLVKEIGDVLWYLAMICEQIDVPLSVAALRNLEKLASRKERGVLGGSGSDR